MNISFIGNGNMAGAIIGGLLKMGSFEASDIAISDVSGQRRQDASQKGFRVFSSNFEAASASDIIVLAVKPIVMAKALEDICTCEGKLVISIAAGISSDFIRQRLHPSCRIVRVMPNTPALYGEGMSMICEDANASSDDMLIVKTIFESVGKVDFLPEKLIDAAMAVGSSGPAYIFMIIEALADGGVLCSLPRDKAYAIAAQTVLGSAKMVLESGMHPGQLKDMVCSPGGTTIEAMAVLEKRGVRGAIMEAVKACADKAGRLAK